MFNLFKKKKKVQSKWLIPEKEIIPVLELLDAVCLTDGFRVVRHQLWVKLQTIFPELDLINGRWKLHSTPVLKPYIEKKE